MTNKTHALYQAYVNGVINGSPQAADLLQDLIVHRRNTIAAGMGISPKIFDHIPTPAPSPAPDQADPA